MKLLDIVRQVKARIRRPPKARKREMPLLTWEELDPEGENAKQELLQNIERDIREQVEELDEALRGKN